MKSINTLPNIFFLLPFLLTIGSCEPEPELEDPCLKTKWSQAKEFEIKLAIHMMQSNPNLLEGTPGSQNPVDYEKMLVNGTIEKVDCSDQKTGFCNLGNTYITKGIDLPAPIGIPKSYWIGHVVYVYELGNDKDSLNINLTVKITMEDGQSYICNVAEGVNYQQIMPMLMDMYYYILLEIYSDNWVKV